MLHFKEEDLNVEDKPCGHNFRKYFPINVFRFKLSQEVNEEVGRFAKLHRYDPLDTFKEAWFQWSEEHMELLEREIRRLRNLGYHGDVEEKLFKSARYYFRNKIVEKREPAQRRCYTSCPKRLFVLMEGHIQERCSAGSFKPSDGFDDFYEVNAKVINEEMDRLGAPVDFFKEKLKKTYKNRYFRFMTNNR